MPPLMDMTTRMTTEMPTTMEPMIFVTQQDCTFTYPLIVFVRKYLGNSETRVIKGK